VPAVDIPFVIIKQRVEMAVEIKLIKISNLLANRVLKF